MRRREFIAALGGAAAWPLTARAQQPAMPVVGVLSLCRPMRIRCRPFPQGFGGGRLCRGQECCDRIPLARHHPPKDFPRSPLNSSTVRSRCVTTATTAAFAAMAATSTIPIVVAGGADPVK